MDDLVLLLDRAVSASLDAGVQPSADDIRRRAHRRSATRVVASVALVVVMTVGGVIGLASAGRASETTTDVALTSAPAHAVPPTAP